MRALPQHVRSEAPVYPRDRFLAYEDLAKLVRWIIADFGPFVLLAESFSSPLAIQIAAETPPNLKGLVLCAGFAESPVRGLTGRLGSMLAPVIVRTTLLKTDWLIGKNAPPSLAESVKSAISSVPPGVLAARFRAVLACDVRSELARISVPVLYLRARQDRLVPPRCLERIRRVKPDTRAIDIDGPHLLLQRKLKETAEIITEFLNELQ